MGFDGTHYNKAGADYPRVTWILGVLDKPFLATWKMNEMARCIAHDYNDLEATGRDVDIDLLLLKAKKQPDITRDAAGARGTYIHNVLERWIKGEDIKPMLSSDPDMAKLIKNAGAWFVDNQISDEQTEITLYSDKYGYAGTADLVCKMKNHVEGGEPITALIDFKSGKSIYKNHRLQMAAYAMAYQETHGTRPDLCFVIHITPAYGFIPKLHMHYHEIAQEFEIFLKVLDLWKWSNNK